MQVLMFLQVLKARVEAAADVTLEALNTEVGDLNVPLEVELGVVSLVAVWSHAAVQVH